MSSSPWEARHRGKAARMRTKHYDEDGVVEGEKSLNDDDAEKSL